MSRPSVHRNTAIQAQAGPEHQHGIHTRDVPVRGVSAKRLIRQAHGLIKKLFMVHAEIVGGYGRGVHAYFPKGFIKSILEFFCPNQPDITGHKT